MSNEYSEEKKHWQAQDLPVIPSSEWLYAAGSYTGWLYAKPTHYIARTVWVGGPALSQNIAN
jgi:hypothetical protein